MGHLLDSIELPDLVEGVNAGRKTTVKAEDLLFNHCGKWQVVKELSELLPHLCVTVLPQAFIVESIPLKCQDDGALTLE